MDQLTAEDPSHIGPYRLIARLGAGGMGLVYLGRSEAGRTVAVKVVQAEYAEQAEFRRRFAREVDAARRVGGSWTAGVLDADTGADVPWVATQYVPGPSLTAVVARDFGPLPERSVRILADRLALALRAVHGAGLIHRDLKPSNVLVTVDGPRVIDFGIVRAMDGLVGDSLHTRTGMLIGSPGFMSPEQVRGLELTPASDVFCLGAVLVYAATGRLLFGAADSNLNAHLFRVAEEEPDLTGVPASLEGLVRACLDKDPARRPTPAQISAAIGGSGDGSGRGDGSGDGSGSGRDDGGVWLPGEILAQLGRHAAQLLDYVPEPRSAPPTPTPAPPAPAPAPPAPGYTPTERAHVPAPTAAPVPGRRGGRVALGLAQVAVLLGLVQGVWGPDASYRWGPGLSWSAVAFAALLLPGGHLADVRGRRGTLALGLTGFAVACLLGVFGEALDLTDPVRHAAAVLQGGCGALALTASLAVTATGPRAPRERTGTFGRYAAVCVGAAVAGLLALRLLSSDVLLLACSVAALAALAGVRTLPSDPPPRGRLSLPGALLGAFGPGLLLVGTGWPWPNFWVVGPSAAGLVLLGLFWWQQRRDPGRLLPPDVVTGGDRIGGLLVAVLTGAGFLCLLPPLTDMVEDAADGAVLATCVPMLLLAAGAAVGAASARARLRRPAASPRALAVTGLLTTVAGVAGGILALASGQTDTFLPIGTAVAGLGSGLALVPVYCCATATTDTHRAGGAAGAVLAAQLAGQALGTSVLYATADTPPWWAAACLLLAALLARTSLPGRTPTPPPHDDLAVPTPRP
ncbi:bifunctional serine/threonine protein kinase/MFS transporter [Kitasatospora sp. NPDC001540]|uniref:bifunctional serine/threonine protein kinase/MFS transporter n=1 Tax=Kitasatospora sp. NPDC001540 TaxID=3364014 RepID=UPI0036CFE63F